MPLLRPFDAEGMEAYPVSLAVNSPKFNSPDCIKPLKAMK
jgi:putative SOS response-associated peptidase YedK